MALTLEQEVRQQMLTEVGEKELTKEDGRTLMMKYGLSPVILTQSERNLVKREDVLDFEREQINTLKAGF